MSVLFFQQMRIFSWAVCSQRVSGSYPTAHFQLELSWQVGWWCSSYKTTWIIPGDISAGLRALNHPSVSCNPDYTDRTGWLSIIFSIILSFTLYSLNSVAKWFSKRKMWMILRTSLARPPVHQVFLSLSPTQEVEASWIPRPYTQRGKSTGSLCCHPSGEKQFLPIRSSSNILREQPDFLALQTGHKVCSCSLCANSW